MRAHLKGKVTLPSKAGPSTTNGKRKREVNRSIESESDEAGENDLSGEDDSGAVDEEELDTDDEIAAAQTGKSKKTAKRKRRATSPSTFGAALRGLLGDEALEGEQGVERHVLENSNRQPAILSLAPHIRRGAQSSRLNAKAARLALAARRKREDRAHIRDVIGGWGAPGEVLKTRDGDDKPTGAAEGDQLKSWLEEGGAQGYEKKLRKSAQRGVVKLFNAIRAAQNTTEEDLKDDGKASKRNAAQQNGNTSRTSASENLLGGRAKAVNDVSKNNFFDLLRAGTKSKAAAT